MLGIILMIPGTLFIVNFQVMRQFTEVLPIIVPLAFYMLLFMYFTVFVWIFPLYVHLENNLISHFKNALVIGIAKLPITILMMISIFVLFYVSLALPTMLLFFTFSILATLLMKWGMKGFNSVDFVTKS